MVASSTTCLLILLSLLPFSLTLLIAQRLQFQPEFGIHGFGAASDRVVGKTKRTFTEKLGQHRILTGEYARHNAAGTVHFLDDRARIRCYLVIRESIFGASHERLC